MKITLISPYPDITAFGIRTISSYLAKHGYQTQIILLPDPQSDRLVMDDHRYNDETLEQVVKSCDGSDLIGITVMTNFYYGAVQITKKLKNRLKAPIVWGGIHPTVKPEECLEFADLVSIGEAEETVFDLVERLKEGEQYNDIPGLWIKNGPEIIKNRNRPLTLDLDKYPSPDYLASPQYILDEGRVKSWNMELLKKWLELNPFSIAVKKTIYQTLTGRGCPHHCTYCCNSNLRGLNPKERYLRWRSCEHVIDELVQVRRRLPFVEYIWISDDSFFSRKTEDLMLFSKLYKEEIGLPFFCLTSPVTISEEKMDCLVDAGLNSLQMGIESGSKRMNAIFERQEMTAEKIDKALKIINKYKNKILPPLLDFILDAPYETQDDQLETLELIARMPKPYRLQLFSVILYPGTHLYEKVKREGLIKDEKKEIYNRNSGLRKPTYLNLLLTLCRGGQFPKRLLLILINRRLVNLLHNGILQVLFEFLFNFGRKIKALKANVAAKKS
jgi:radical SAM superfamily enzyme YgiQ (UPF0313 family)